MEKGYRHQGFPTDEAFIAHHRQRAEQGDERSIRVMDTHQRVLLSRLDWKARARYCADSFEPEALNQK